MKKPTGRKKKIINILFALDQEVRNTSVEVISSFIERFIRISFFLVSYVSAIEQCNRPNMTHYSSIRTSGAMQMDDAYPHK